MSRERGNQMAKKNEEVNEETLDKEIEKTAEPKEAEKSNEEVWSIRIKEGRASRIDYFIEVKGMSKEEAIAKVAEIDALNTNLSSATA